MRNTILQEIDFGRTGNSRDHIIGGWSLPEEGHTWTIDKKSSIFIDTPKAPHGFAVEVTWWPYAPNARFRMQSVRVSVAGQPIINHVVDRFETVCFLCPPVDTADPRIVIEFEHLTAIPPRLIDPSNPDSRTLALRVRRIRILRCDEQAPACCNGFSHEPLAGKDAIHLAADLERRSGIAVHDLFSRFELIAGNCDMGLAMRQFGFESLSLLKFAGAIAAVAVRGIDTDFEGIGEQLSADIANNPPAEWMVNDKFGLRYHTGQSSRTVSEEQVIASQRRSAKFMRRKLLEDLEDGEKIFVYADHHAVRPLEAALPLFLALNRHRPNRMLWVCLGEGGNRGHVHEVLPGLARATIDRFAPPLAAGHISVAGWLTVLYNAWRLFLSPTSISGANAPL